jgi:hypothetical protein
VRRTRQNGPTQLRDTKGTQSAGLAANGKELRIGSRRKSMIL